MFSAILILLAMPYADLSRSRGTQFRPLNKIVFFIFVANFLILMQLGAKHVESPFIELGQMTTILYFSFFLALVPIFSLLENTFTKFFATDTYLNDKYLDNNVNIEDIKEARGLHVNPPILSGFSFN